MHRQTQNRIDKHGEDFYQMQYDGSIVKKWRTAPLWGVGSVPLQQAIAMAEVLEKAKAPHRLSIHKKKGHMRITEDVIQETRAFIEEVSKR